jgi:TfoX/Sxy family transcriptional regulator of competence genes
MASQQSTIDFIVEQMAGAGAVIAHKMFGEYGIYCEGRMVALVCDDQLFVKPTVGGRRHVGQIDEASPYKNAKPHFVIPGEKWDDADWLAMLIKITARELPVPVKARRTPLGTG